METGITHEEAANSITQIADGRYFTKFKGKDLMFRPLTLGERSQMTSVYSKEVLRLTMQEDGTINEAGLPGIVERRLKAMGLDPKAADARFRLKWAQRIAEVLPPALLDTAGATNQQEALIAATSMLDKFNDEEFHAIQSMNAAQALITELEGCTVEAQARALRLRHEMLIAVTDIDGVPVWASMDALMAEEHNDEFSLLTREYAAFREGGNPDFLSLLSSLRSGAASGTSQEGTAPKSSRGKSSSGPRSKKPSSKRRSS